MAINFTPINLPSTTNKIDATATAGSINFTPLDLNSPNPDKNTSTLHNVAHYADYINSFGGGVEKAGAGAVEGTLDLAPFTLQHLHIISPETSNKLQGYINKATNVLRPTTNSISGQAMQEHPITEKIGEYGADTGLLVGGMGVANSLGEGAATLAPGIPRTAGVLGRALGMGLVNKAAGGDFTTGAAISPVLDLGGYAIGKIGGQAAAKADLTNAIQSYTKSAVNKAYNVVTSLPFTDVEKSSLTKIAGNIDNVLKNTDPARFIGSQAQTLSNYRDQLLTANNFNDTLTILKNLGSDSKKLFSGSKVFPELYTSVQGFKGDIENIINQSAIKNGVESALNNASNLATKTRIVGKVFNGMTENENFSFKGASTKLGKLIDTYSTKPYMGNTVDTLRGLKKLTDAAATSIKIPSNLVKLTTGGAGAYEGYKHGGAEGAVAGGVAGIVGSQAFIEGAKLLSTSSLGQKTLASLAKPGWKMREINNISKAVTLTGLKTLKNLYETSNQQTP